jgi:hypothetical protein
MRVGLVPLDERPVNTRYPAMIARIAGVDLCLPPTELLPALRSPAPCDDLATWLRDVAPHLDAMIVSCELLGYGGLIASRISNEAVGTIIGRLDLLRMLKHQYPDLTILGFDLITRVSNANSAFEEPQYWQQYGTRLYQLSQALDQQEQDFPVSGAVAVLQAQIPPLLLRDFLQRRLRNHTVNLAVLQLLADGVLDLLVLSSDDTSPYGLPSREKRWLQTWATRLLVGERLLMYPGADEVGCALLARLRNAAQGQPPRCAVHFAVAGGEQVVAAYEDVPIQTTVERQVRAVGGVLVDRDADLDIMVNPPVPRRSEWHSDYAVAERHERLAQLQAAVDLVQQHQAAGQPVIVADVAYPNGADPVLTDLLRTQINLPQLAAYGAWNTAGNTIGTALAQGCAARLIASDEQRVAHEQFLLHRLLEDWGYQQVVRREVRDWLHVRIGMREPLPEQLSATCRFIEARLQSLIADLPGFVQRYRVVPGSVRLPWQRTFEVDFELAPVAAEVHG